jgi:hypothetical protein
MNYLAFGRVVQRQDGRHIVDLSVLAHGASLLPRRAGDDDATQLGGRGADNQRTIGDHPPELFAVETIYLRRGWPLLNATTRIFRFLGHGRWPGYPHR